jgi:DNA repair photolyase
MVAPILPGISDGEHQLREVVEAAIDAGATHVSPILLHLRPKVKEVYMEWLADNYPDLVERYVRMYPGSNAPRSQRAELSQRVAAIKKSVGPRSGHRLPESRWTGRARREIASLKSEQLSLM